MDHLGSCENAGSNLAGLGQGRSKVRHLLPALGRSSCWNLDHTWNSKDFGITKQTVEAGRTWESGVKSVLVGAGVFPGAEAGYIWQISLWGIINPLTLHFGYTGLQQLYPSRGRICWFAYS